MQDQNIAILVDELGKADSKEKMKNLLRGLLTPKELEELAERVRIVQFLKKGVAQHSIAEKLHVGVATVSRGAREIKMGNFITI
jgi:TrpR family trp operon transcriptional repressor